jgi:glutamate/tyrosine decarboxylase-like PLP-dependent enzyme
MLPRLVRALRQHTSLLSSDNEGGRVWELLNSMPSGLGRGTGRLFADYPPVIFVAGTHHYSISKAADLLGMGQENIVSVDVDASFRMKADSLKKCIRAAVKAKRIPLAVVATSGTTEEGAVDPIDAIISVREALHSEDISFWLHIDAAWSGFIRSLFNLSPHDEAIAVAKKATAALGITTPPTDLVEWHDRFENTIHALATAAITPPPGTNQSPAAKRVLRDERFHANVSARLQQMRIALDTKDFESYSDILLRLPGYFDQQGWPLPNGESFSLTAADRKAILDGYVRHELVLSQSGYRRRLSVLWPPKEVFNAFLAFPRAESIAVDPHKMGYAPYPSGCVAFRNDRVRLFILQKAPYITAVIHNPLFHVPPRHAALDEAEKSQRSVVVESFGPYMLEGSKPGAAAAGLWLSTRTVPLTMRAHGSIVRSSILAARDIYEWLKEWHSLAAGEPHGIDFQFIPLTPGPPDTNLVTFVVKKRTSPSLNDINALTARVYKSFTILSELGERQYSYSQAFFLSRTVMKQSEYPAEVLSAGEPRKRCFFARCALNSAATREYKKNGLVVLRAAVMNPYLTPLHDLKIQDMCRTLVQELAAAAAAAVRDINVK